MLLKVKSPDHSSAIIHLQDKASRKDVRLSHFITCFLLQRKGFIMSFSSKTRIGALMAAVIAIVASFSSTSEAGCLYRAACCPPPAFCDVAPVCDVPACAPICSPVCRPICPPVCAPACAPICRPVCKPICPPVCAPACAPICRPVCKPICPPVCAPACPPVCKPCCPILRCRVGFCNPCFDSFDDADPYDCGTFGGDVVDTPETAPTPAQDPTPAQAPESKEL